MMRDAAAHRLGDVDTCGIKRGEELPPSETAQKKAAYRKDNAACRQWRGSPQGTEAHSTGQGLSRTGKNGPVEGGD